MLFPRLRFFVAISSIPRPRGVCAKILRQGLARKGEIAVFSHTSVLGLFFCTHLRMYGMVYKKLFLEFTLNTKIHIWSNWMRRMEHNHDFTFLMLLFVICYYRKREHLSIFFWYYVIIIFDIDFDFFQFLRIAINFLIQLALSDFLSKHIDLWL